LDKEATIKRARTAVLLALILIVVFELVLRAIEDQLPPIERWPTSQMSAKVKQMEQLVSDGEQIDVVFVGSSVVEEGIDPVTFNSVANGTAYNAALGAASMRSLERFVVDVVLPLTQPDTIVIGVTARDLNDGGISQSDYFDRLSGSAGMLMARTPQNPLEWIENWLFRHLAIFRLRPLLRDPARMFAAALGTDDQPELDSPEPGPFGSDQTYEGEPYDNSAAWGQPWAARQVNNFSMGGTELESLRRLLSELREEGVRVVVVNMPVSSDFADYLPDPSRDMATFDRLLETTAREYDATYLDAQDRFSIEDFRDPAHLKPDAAAELTALLDGAIPQSAE
jgi:DltD protein